MTIRVMIVNSEQRRDAVIAVEIEPLQYQTDTGIELKNFPMVPAGPFRPLQCTVLKPGRAAEFWVHEFQRLRISEIKIPESHKPHCEKFKALWEKLGTDKTADFPKEVPCTCSSDPTEAPR